MIFQLTHCILWFYRLACISIPLAFLLIFPAQANSSMKIAGLPVDTCIQGAAKYHDLDPQLLRAILVVESRLNPKAVNRNRNGTRDIGMAQINSIHLATLAQHGIQETHLMDACVNTYVGAWLLRKQIARHGLNWFGVAAYHSTTPAKNYRYQVLVYNEMVRSGAIQNTAMAVPASVK